MAKSHWVPVVYLKNFGFFLSNVKKNSRNKKIHFFNKHPLSKEEFDNIDIQRLSLDEICMSDEYYSEDMEKYLNIQVETDTLNDTLTKIITEKSVKTINNNQKLSIQIFILSQLLRTPGNIRRKLEMIKWLKTLPKEVYDKSIQNYENDIPQENLPSTKEEYQKMFEKNIYLASKFPKLLKDFKMQIWINKTNVQFYSSDNPVIDKTNFMFWNNKIFELKTKYSPPTPKLILPVNPQILILFEKVLDINPKNYPSKIFVKDFNKALKINNGIIRNAEEVVLMKSKKQNELKSAIKINLKCLEKKHYIYKVMSTKNVKPNLTRLVETKKDYACKLCGKIYHTKEGIERHLEKYCKIKNRSN